MMPDREELKLLDERLLVVTGPRDKARWNFSPQLSWLQKTRFRMVAKLMGANRYENILEIGYGSGIFLPELYCRCEHLFGVDVHPFGNAVARALAIAGVQATLFSASAESLPIKSRSMDLIVSVSTLEYVPDKTRAVSEMSRILRPCGRAIVVQPLQHIVLDTALKLITGEDAEQYGDGREALLPALRERFSVERRITFPAHFPLALQVYRAVLLVQRA